ncbi:ATP-dependent Clp protease adaptor ClpS [Maribellus sp. YY47]|uniref:ATP-dependent Clp protease adaptor ClpS n=1 Tax=Maribellus sp. YY47 TaxID=2929486 RepID=UPI002000CAD6|nr:ATP-dependent Clp protease adaptor ClpS [Maribellus sp. YY47]MCK3684044.1 ATP-dependent Clp protease adaptor ClpS [Maribellus sp. YY47]
MTLKEPKNIPTQKPNEEVLKENSLILHNDDVHTFDYVIDALIDICDHEIEQATQCTYLVHYKGKCDVKKGTFSTLKPMKDALIERELNATID